jgi:hypothetical protein
MSSREQYKGALKDTKQTIANLKKEIQGLKNRILLYEKELAIARPIVERVSKRKWYQFWISK